MIYCLEMKRIWPENVTIKITVRLTVSQCKKQKADTHVTVKHKLSK